MTSRMESEYDSPALKSTIQAEIELIILPIFVRENVIFSVSEGLAKVVERINFLTPKAYLPFQNEQHKIKHLCLAVLSSPWSQTIIIQLSTSLVSFNGLIFDLREYLYLAYEYGWISKFIN